MGDSREEPDRDTVGNSEHFPILSKTDMTIAHPNICHYDCQHMKDPAE